MWPESTQAAPLRLPSSLSTATAHLLKDFLTGGECLEFSFYIYIDFVPLGCFVLNGYRH